jgi:hypothetical protein
VISDCPPAKTITRWATLAEAEDAIDRIDRGACGSRCLRRHRLVTLEVAA